MCMVADAQAKKIYIVNAEEKTYSEYSTNGQLQKRLNVLSFYNANSKTKFSPWKDSGSNTVKGMKVHMFKRSMLSPPHDAVRHITTSFDEEVWIAPLPDYKYARQFFKPLVNLFSHEHLPEDG